jgi:hypothetical protein
MGERTAGDEVGTAFDDGGLALVRAGLVILGSVGDRLEHRVMALHLNDAQRRSQVGFGQLVHQAVQLLPGRHASIVPRLLTAKPVPRLGPAERGTGAGGGS